MTIHEPKIKDMREDLDDLFNMAKEYQVYDVSIVTFNNHMQFIYDQLERINFQIEKICYEIDTLKQYKRISI